MEMGESRRLAAQKLRPLPRVWICSAYGGGRMKRLALFFIGPAIFAAGFSIAEHGNPLGRPIVTEAAASLHRALCQ